jgi:hypothetical protein
MGRRETWTSAIWPDEVFLRLGKTGGCSNRFESARLAPLSGQGVWTFVRMPYIFA